MKVDGSISSLIQGVSQQPQRERLPGQCTLQENFSSDPVNGLTRRAPTAHIAKLITGMPDYTFTDYNGGSLGRFVIAFKTGDLRVFDLDGTEYTVTIASGGAYLSSTQMQFIGIDENIYVVNTEQVVAMQNTSKSYYDNVGLTYVLGANYSRTYQITVKWGANTVVASYQTPNGSVATHAAFLDTSSIMTQLVSGTTGLTASATFNANFDYGQVGDIVWIKPKVGSGITSFSMEVIDGDGGNNLKAFVNNTDDVATLPRYAPHRTLVEITGSGSADQDNWYLEFLVNDEIASGSNTMGAGFGKDGKWVETVAPNIEYQLDAATMPHVLTKTGPTTFTYAEGEWEDREVGDDLTNPLPSFVDHTISDAGAFQGRLVFLSDVNCIMSRTNKHTNFFSQSATAQLDDDPIDVSSALGTFQLKRLVPHNRDLVIFSDNAQFIVFGRNALTPKNCSLVLTTEFEADLRAEPVAAGRNIFFAFKYGTFSGVQEFFTEGGEDVNNSRSITQNVLQYISGTPLQMVSTTNFNKMLFRTGMSLKTMFVYEYIWLNDQKVQSSWSTWKFSRDVVYAFFVDNLLYFIVIDDDGYSLQTVDLDDTPDAGVTYRSCLDDKVLATGVNLTFNYPYDIADLDDYVVVQGEGCPYPGLRAPILSVVGNTVTLKDDMGGGDVYIGRRYLSRYVPTSPFVKDRENVKIGSGKLTIKQFVLHFDKTGFVRAVITDDYGYSAQVEYQGRVIGYPNNLVGEAAVSDGSFLVPFKKNPDNAQLEIQSDSHLPLSLLELEWSGQWRKKGQRITGG